MSKEDSKRGSTTPMKDKGKKEDVISKIENKIKKRAGVDIDKKLATASGDNMSKYLQEIRRYPLLTREEEVELAKKIQRGKKAEQTLERDGNKISARLEEAVSEGDRAKNIMLLCNQRLVVSIAKKKYARTRALPMIDLIQEGNIGLISAVERFDYRKGYKFSTYATWWIQQAISRGVDDKSRTIRLPSHAVSKVIKITRVISRIKKEKGEYPSLEVISKETDISLDKVKKLISISKPTYSLEENLSEGSDSDYNLYNVLVDESNKPVDEEIADRMLFDSIVEFARENFSKRTFEMFKLRYGLDNGKEHTLNEIGEIYGLTRERIRQILIKAEQKLQYALEEGII